MNDIAKKNSQDPKRLGELLAVRVSPLRATSLTARICQARLLRFMATYHVFREVTPDVFANNRVSSLLDTGKDIDVILAK